MQKFRDSGFLNEDTLTFAHFGRSIVLSGQIACLGRTILTVDKKLALSGNRDTVQTKLYSYNASVSGHGNIFRYDNAHLHAGHADEHHKHHFDWKTSNEIAPPSWIGVHGWPTLGEVIEELRSWHSEHYSELDHPDDFPPSLATGIR